MSLKLGNTAINKTYLGSVEIKKLYIGTNLIYDNSSIDTVVTIDTTSDSATWTPTNIVNSGATLTWEVTGDISPPIAPQVIDKPILNLSSNTGTANITITSSTNFVGFSELWLNNGTTSLEVTDVDISEATALTKIDLFNNNLTTIDISANTALVNPWVQSNTLTAFDPSTNVLAEFIAVDTNSLTALDISANVLLTDLWVYDNLLTTAELDAIINDLDTNGLSNGVVKLAGNTGLPLTAASGTAYDALVGKGWDIDVAKYTPVDTEDPVIGTLAYANETDTTVELSMSVASTDNIAVVEHWIYKDFVFEEIVVGATFTDHEITGLTANTNYDFACVAYDAAGNFSLTSNTVNFTTDATPTPPATDVLKPILSNFRVLDSQKGRLYFNSSEIITASTGVNGYTGFTITDKVISQITINTGLLVDHYFDVTVDFTYYHNNTIRYEGGSDLADSDSNGIYDFLITHIENNIVEPSTLRDRYVTVSGAGTSDGSLGNEWTLLEAFDEAIAGDHVHIEAGSYGATEAVLTSEGNATNPIIFEGYDSTYEDSPSLTRELDLTFDPNVMPYLVSGTTGKGITLQSKEYVIIKNIQIEGYESCFNINNCSNIILDNVYAKDGNINGIRIVLSPSKYIRVLNSYTADNKSHGMWMYGAYHLVKNTWSVTSRIVNMDYHISYNAGSLENGYNIIKDCYIHSYWDDTHGDHGISIKGEPSKLSEYTLIENCTLENNGQGIEFRHENSKRNVARNCYGTRTSAKITAARYDAALVTFRDGCSYNTVIDCNMDTLSHGILFQDNYNEEGQQAGGHYNKVINSVFENNDWDIYVANGIYYPGGIYPLEPTNNEFLNCTFYNSTKLVSTSVVPFGSSNIFTNCILESIPSYEGSPSFSYSDFYVSFPVPSGTDNISFKPNFTDKDNGDFSLNSQTPSEVYEGGTDVGVYYDKLGYERITPYSMGAYEYPRNLLLLFKTDFEGTVALDTWTGQEYVYFSGSSLGYTFPIDDLLGMGTGNGASGPEGIHMVDGGIPSNIDAELESRIGRLGVLSTLLHQQVINNPGVNQTPWQFNDVVTNPDEFYMSYWIKLGADDIPINTWRALWEYKTQNYMTGDSSGARLGVFIYRDAIDDDYFRLQLDTNPLPVYVWNDKAQMTIPRGKWFKFEIYFKFRHDNTGEAWTKINGVKILEKTNVPTSQGDNSIKYFLTTQVYGTSGLSGLDQWVDDVEIWSKDPNITFVSATSVSVLPATDSIDAVETTQLTSTVLPSNADNKSGIWYSDDEAVATVDEAGLVTGVASGSATITFTTTDGSFTDTSIITVNPSYGSEILDVSNFTLGTGITRNGTELTFNTDSNQAAYEQSLSINGNVRFSYEIISYTSGAPSINITGGTGVGIQNLNTIIGTHTIDYDSGSSNTNFFLYGGTFGNGGEYVIDNISLKEEL